MKENLCCKQWRAVAKSVKNYVFVADFFEAIVVDVKINLHQ